MGDKGSPSWCPMVTVEAVKFGGYHLQESERSEVSRCSINGLCKLYLSSVGIWET